MKYQDTVSNVKQIISEYGYALTLRQIFYRLVSDYGLRNNKTTYTGLSKQLVKAREQGDIQVNAIEDRSRGIISSNDVDSGDPLQFLEDQIDELKEIASSYSMSMWEPQDYYIEVWVEKDALSQVISRISRKYCVLTAPSRGYSSFSYIYDAVKRFQREGYGKKGLVLHFSDHDPSGLDMTRDLQSRLRSYGADVEVKRIGLTYEQVQQYKLSPNPTKNADPRSKEYVEQYGNECWELDALPPDVLQQLVEDNIQEYIDQDKWDEREQEIEDNQELIQDKVDEFFKNINGGDE